jgi:hypothetical protein
VRSLLILLALTGVAGADPPLWNAELRLGYGFEVIGGDDNMTAAHSAPMTLEGIAAYAFNDDPWLYGYGGFVVETLDRNSIGGVGGIQIASGPLRARVGGVYIFAPNSLYGLNVSGGVCRHLTKMIKGCGDLSLTEYFAGKDIVQGHAVTQVQLVFGMVIDGT